MSEMKWRHGQYEALWEDPDPRTPEGQRLWQLFQDGKLGPSPSGIRDFGQRICQIEAEAAARLPDSEVAPVPSPDPDLAYAEDGSVVGRVTGWVNGVPIIVSDSEVAPHD